MRAFWRFAVVASAYRHPVVLDERGDWTRIVGRLFWLRRAV